MSNINYERKVYQQAYHPRYIRSAYQADCRRDDPAHYIDREIMQVISKFIEEHRCMPKKLIVSRPIYDYYGDEIESFDLEFEVLAPEDMGPENQQYMIRLEGQKVE